MNTTIKAALDGLTLGEVQTSGPLALAPILAGSETGPAYLSLAQAARDQVVEIREIDQGGSVPELRLVSSATIPILIIDGEELAGAKQNRAVNTTILVAAGKTMTIPVSCTEQGRWRYTSPAFDNSDEVLAAKARRGKMRSVARSLRQTRRYASDQGQVWADIADVQACAEVDSPTGAMKDVYTARAADFGARLADFSRVDGQRGFVFLNEGKVAGVEFVSDPNVYADLHDKLLRSYVSEHLGVMTTADPMRNEAAQEIAHAFLAELAKTPETSYPGVGLGTDYRYEDDARCAAGLVHEDTCVHFAAFADQVVQSDRAEGMRSASERRRTMRRRRN